MEDFCLGRAAGARLPLGPSVRPSALTAGFPAGVEPGTGEASSFPRGQRPAALPGPVPRGSRRNVRERGAAARSRREPRRFPGPAGNGFLPKNRGPSVSAVPSAGARRGSGTPAPVTGFRCRRDRSAALPLRSVTVTVTARRGRVPRCARCSPAAAAGLIHRPVPRLSRPEAGSVPAPPGKAAGPGPAGPPGAPGCSPRCLGPGGSSPAAAGRGAGSAGARSGSRCPAPGLASLRASAVGTAPGSGAGAAPAGLPCTRGPGRAPAPSRPAAAGSLGRPRPSGTRRKLTGTAPG